MVLSKNIKSDQIAGWLCILLIVIGLFFNRVMISIGVIGLVLLNINRITQLRSAWISHSRLMIGLFILIVLPFISGLWSENITEWWHRCQMKLPLVAIPLILFSISWHNKVIKLLNLSIIGIILAGCLWSLAMYIADWNTINQGYSQGWVMPVLFGKDHQRFSWAVLSAICLSFQLIEKKALRPEIGYSLLIFFALFMHILATRTGVICLYISFVIWLVFYAIKYRYRAIFLGAIFISLPILAYQFSTPFKNKIHYMLYDLNKYKEGHIVEGLSDASRFVAIQGTWEKIKESPWLGVGYGDVKSEIHEWYETHPETVGQAERLMPPSQWAFYIMGCGVLAALLIPFAFYFILACNKSILSDPAWWSFNVCGIFLCIFETPFEGQRGPVLYALTLALMILINPAMFKK